MVSCSGKAARDATSWHHFRLVSGRAAMPGNDRLSVFSKFFSFFLDLGLFELQCKKFQDSWPCGGLSRTARPWNEQPGAIRIAGDPGARQFCGLETASSQCTTNPRQSMA